MQKCPSNVDIAAMRALLAAIAQVADNVATIAREAMPPAEQSLDEIEDFGAAQDVVQELATFRVSLGSLIDAAARL